MHAHLLRRNYVKQFSSFGRLGVPAAWAVVLLYVSTIVVCVVAGYLLLNGPITFPEAFALVLLMILTATRLRGLNNIVHECSHSTFCRSREQNVLIGRVCASFTLSSFKKYKDEHLSHHAHLGDAELDRDFRGIAHFGLNEKLDRLAIIRHVVTPLMGKHLPYYVSIDLSDDDGAWFKWLRVSLVFSGIAFTAAEPVPGALLILIPYLLVFSSLNYWADCIDHAGLIGSEDELDASRNVIVPRIVKWLFFPRNDSYHLVHHLFPQVPARHLETAHKILVADSLYATKSNAVGRGSAPEFSNPQNDLDLATSSTAKTIGT